VNGVLRRRGALTVAGLALAVAGVAAAIIVIIALHGSQAPSQTSVAAGEVIYRTGTFNGRPISRTGGLAGGMMGGDMMGAASCASCHGRNGQGKTTATFTAPNITYSNLTDPKGMLAPDGSRGPTYADATLRRAVTTGVDPTGGHLAAPMPQWQLTSQEWADLLAYLKTLR
jgi:mono/diheme cytochrome c family protein